MDKIIKICCGGSDTDAVEPNRSRQHLNQLVPAHTLGQQFQHLAAYGLRGKKQGNSFLISEAHFLPNGNLHDIVISFDGEERTKMMVAIDNKIVSELDIKDKLEGSTELYLNEGQYLNNELVVDFKWNLNLRIKTFKFYTKTSSNKRTIDNSSYNNGNNHEEVEFEGECYLCRLNVYAVE